LKTPRREAAAFFNPLSQAGAVPSTSGHGAPWLERSDSEPVLKGDSMFEGLFQPMHLILLFGIALLVFGPKKLPELGKGLGESIRGFKSAMAAKEGDKPTPPKPDSTTNLPS
jgi:sec-independent protein translocase protein TatA